MNNNRSIKQKRGPRPALPYFTVSHSLIVRNFPVPQAAAVA